MSPEDRRAASELRQQIAMVLQHMERMLRHIHTHEPLVKGTVYRRERKRADGSIRCTEAFCYSQQGKTRHVPLHGHAPKRLRKYAANYRRFRTARAELCKAWAELLCLIDHLEALRHVPVDRALRPSENNTTAAVSHW
jgi:hypothetical protein